MSNDTEVDGPRYKLCTFLFGNVDKRGKLEGEYAEDEELSSINQIDSCRVSEVETTIRTIVSDAASAIPSDVSVSKSTSSAEINPPPEPQDYYDESEVIRLDTIENVVPETRNEDYVSNHNHFANECFHDFFNLQVSQFRTITMSLGKSTILLITKFCRPSFPFRLAQTLVYVHHNHNPRQLASLFLQSLNVHRNLHPR